MSGWLCRVGYVGLVMSGSIHLRDCGIKDFKVFQGYFTEEFKAILALKNTKVTARRLPLVDS